MGSGDQALAAGGTEGLLASPTQVADALPALVSYLDRDGRYIRTHELTGDDTADATMAGPLVATPAR